MIVCDGSLLLLSGICCVFLFQPWVLFQTLLFKLQLLHVSHSIGFHSNVLHPRPYVHVLFVLVIWSIFPNLMDPQLFATTTFRATMLEQCSNNLKVPTAMLAENCRCKSAFVILYTSTEWPPRRYGKWLLLNGGWPIKRDSSWIGIMLNRNIFLKQTHNRSGIAGPQ